MTIATLAFYAVAAVLAIVVIGAVVNKEFRNNLLQFLRITGNTTVRSATTAVQKEKDSIKQLLAKLPTQRQRVASVMSTVDANQRAVNAKTVERDNLLKEYQKAQQRNASDTAQAAIRGDWTAAKEAVVTLTATLEASKVTAASAQKSLNDIVSALAAEERNIVTDEGKANLAAAKRENASIQQQLKDMQSGIGELADNHKAVDKDLDDANNLEKLSQGSDTDRERAELKAQSTDDAAKLEIEEALKAAQAGK